MARNSYLYLELTYRHISSVTCCSEKDAQLFNVEDLKSIIHDITIIELIMLGSYRNVATLWLGGFSLVFADVDSQILFNSNNAAASITPKNVAIVGMR